MGRQLGDFGLVSANSRIVAYSEGMPIQNAEKQPRILHYVQNDSAVGSGTCAAARRCGRMVGDWEVVSDTGLSVVVQVVISAQAVTRPERIAGYLVRDL